MRQNMPHILRNITTSKISAVLILLCLGTSACTGDAGVSNVVNHTTHNYLVTESARITGEADRVASEANRLRLLEAAGGGRSRSIVRADAAQTTSDAGQLRVEILRLDTEAGRLRQLAIQIEDETVFDRMRRLGVAEARAQLRTMATDLGTKWPPS